MKKTLKRSLSFVLALTIVFGSALIGLGEIDFSAGFGIEAKAEGIYPWTFELNEDGKSYSITHCDSYVETSELIVPSIYKDLPVTEIGDNAIYSYNAFTIIIPDSIITIGKHAINGEDIRTIKLGSGIKYIGEGAFQGNKNIKTIELGNNVESIGAYAFKECENLETLVIPDSVKTIGEQLFFDCRKLKSVTIGNGVERIEKETFGICESLTDVTLGSNVKYIGEYAFRSCDNLKTLILPDSLTYIDEFAFTSCNGLTTINIPANVEVIGDTFLYCNSLSSITVDENNPNYSAVDGVLFNKNKTEILRYPIAKPGTGYNIPESVTKVGYGAFYRCNSLVTVNIPYGVTEISDSAFSQCENLEISSLPESVTILGGAFAQCTSITSFTVPSGIKKLDDTMFYGCTNLKSVTLPSGLEVIGSSAFSACRALEKITIPNSVTQIGHSAFDQCLSLTSIVLPEGVKVIDKYAFDFCTNLKSITLPESIELIDLAAFSLSNNLTDVYYGGSVEDRAKINIKQYNEPLTKATWHYAKASKPATPKVTTTNEIGGVQVTWNKVAGATKYVVFRRQGGYSTWVNVGTTTGNTLLDKNVKSGIFYVYSVRAYNSAGKYSDFVSANTNTRKFMATPKLTTIYNHVNGLAIKWNAVAGITKGYRVYRRGAGQTTWTYLGTTKNLYFIDSQVKNKSGEYFRYTVIADGGYHSKFDTTGLYLRRLANPTLTSAVSSKSGITVKWGAVKGTTGYYVYRKTANSTWTRVGTVGGTNNTTFLDKTAKKGTTYTYTVKAVYGATTSAYYSGISCKDKY